MNLRIVLLAALCAAFFVFTVPAAAQEKCGTPRHEQLYGQATAEFEAWLAQVQKAQALHGARHEDEVVTLPVVVHVVHSSSESNISVEQIQSQIDVLNRDFRRLSDLGSTPANFQNLAADVQIEFALARRDPEGLPTTGIVRVEADQFSFPFEDDIRLKNHSYWPAEDYINIWVAPLSGGLIGWAQFPLSNEPGLEDSQGNPKTDGIVVDYRYFGDQGNVVPASRGRTATHELGHFFGLRHIWGDGDCGIDDYIDDTPSQESANYQCDRRETCGSEDMIQNFMDYTADRCMSMFTLQQKARMRTILSQSPRRYSLLSSKGTQAPIFVPNDVGVRQVIAPTEVVCEGLITPQVEVRNYGTNLADTYRIELQIDGTPIDTVLGTTDLTSLSTTTLTFSPYSLPSSGQFQLLFRVLSTNGTTDGNAENDSLYYTLRWAPKDVLPLQERFANPNSDWLTVSNDVTYGWESSIVTIDGQPDTILGISLFEYELGIGEEDWLLSPVADLSSLGTSTFGFSVAYAPFPGLETDRLSVRVSTDCGNTFPHTIWEASGNALRTAPSMSAAFVPAHRLDFRPITLDLSAFAGEPTVQVAIVATNGYGNNLYLDDIHWEGFPANRTDLAISAIQGLPWGFNGGEVAPSVTVTNAGQTTITQAVLGWRFGNNPETEQAISGNIPPGGSVEVPLPLSTLNQEGIYPLTVRILEVNGAPDDVADNDRLRSATLVDASVDDLPLRLSNAVDLGQWPAYATQEGDGWQVQSITNLEGNVNMLGNGGNTDPVIGNQAVLVSPNLDLTTVPAASLFFETSYSSTPWFLDSLALWASPDGGATWEGPIWGASGEVLSNVPNSNAPWIPAGITSWELRYVDLHAYLGLPQVRFAWVATNAYGQSIYLRNIEFFLSDDATPFSVEEGPMAVWPNPAEASGRAYVTLNLDSRQPITLQVVDSRGKIVTQRIEELGLNQTYTVDVSQRGAGLYYILLLGEDLRYALPLVVGQ